jgi:hypothetical protein
MYHWYQARLHKEESKPAEKLMGSATGPRLDNKSRREPTTSIFLEA